MITDRHIVCVASNWFDHPTSKHHVMRRLAEHNDVVWINFHGSRRPRLTADDSRAVLRRLGQILRTPVQQVLPRLHVVSPLVVPWPESGVARAVNTWRVEQAARQILRKLPERPLQLWLFTPDMPGLAKRLKPERCVYYCVDDFAAFSGYNAELVTRLEHETVAAADVVLATSQPLLQRLEYEHDHVHFVPHGVDVAHFAQVAQLGAEDIPADVQGLSGPVFGFFGQLYDWVDLELVGDVARQRPAWNFVLLGDVHRDVACVEKLRNVRLLGGRPYETLPAYCRAFDVGIIPFRMNRLVRAVNPIKLREYLAAGLPVVSAPMHEVLRYPEAVFTAETPGEFIAAGERALRAGRETPAATRRALVADESWTARIEAISQVVMAGDAQALRPVASETVDGAGVHSAR